MFRRKERNCYKNKSWFFADLLLCSTRFDSKLLLESLKLFILASVLRSKRPIFKAFPRIQTAQSFCFEEHSLIPSTPKLLFLKSEAFLWFESKDAYLLIWGLFLVETEMGKSKRGLVTQKEKSFKHRYILEEWAFSFRKKRVCTFCLEFQGKSFIFLPLKECPFCWSHIVK